MIFFLHLLSNGILKYFLKLSTLNFMYFDFNRLIESPLIIKGAKIAYILCIHLCSHYIMSMHILQSNDFKMILIKRFLR